MDERAFNQAWEIRFVAFRGEVVWRRVLNEICSLKRASALP